MEEAVVEHVVKETVEEEVVKEEVVKEEVVKAVEEEKWATDPYFLMEEYEVLYGQLNIYTPQTQVLYGQLNVNMTYTGT